jgi:hypothetical protein
MLLGVAKGSGVGAMKKDSDCLRTSVLQLPNPELDH